MEILGLDPKIAICKIAVLPIKLYPLKLMCKQHKPFCKYINNPIGDRTRVYNGENVMS